MSQKLKILDYLAKGNKLTRLQALRLGFGMSLNSRIPEIEAMGYPVSRETITVGGGKKVKRYWFSESVIKKVSYEMR